MQFDTNTITPEEKSGTEDYFNWVSNLFATNSVNNTLGIRYKVDPFSQPYFEFLIFYSPFDLISSKECSDRWYHALTAYKEEVSVKEAKLKCVSVFTELNDQVYFIKHAAKTLNGFVVSDKLIHTYRFVDKWIRDSDGGWFQYFLFDGLVGVGSI